MKKISKREQTLLMITITAIFIGVNYVLVVPLARSWGTTGRDLKNQQRELAGMKAVAQRKGQWTKEYDALKEGLGARTERFQQMSDVQKKIEEVATAAGVQVNARRPMAEEDKGVYRVLPVQCTIEANTETLVRFLYALQTGAGFMSVEQLQISPKPDNPALLRCDIQIRALAGKMEATKS